MKIYTGGGDKGFTALMNNSRVSKTDDRIELLGMIDELSSHLGLSKVLADEVLKKELSDIQSTLMKIMAGISVTSSRQYRLTEADVTDLEEKIDRVEGAFPREKEFVLYGGCEVSARLDVARAVARRAERQFCRTIKYYNVDSQALRYMNRLADYLYVCARYADYQVRNNAEEAVREKVIENILKNDNDR